MTTTTRQIMAICNNTPKPEAHQRYLEGLSEPERQQRLADLQASEQRHFGRVYPRQFTRANRTEGT